MTQNLLAQCVWIFCAAITIFAAINFRKAIGTSVTVAMIVGAVMFLLSSVFGLLTTYRLWGFKPHEESWVIDLHSVMSPWVALIGYVGGVILYMSLYLVSRQVLRKKASNQEMHWTGER